MQKPQNPSIKVSPETLKLIKSWTIQLGCRTYEDCILQSMKWSQDLNSGFIMNQIEMRDRLISNECYTKNNSMNIVRLSNEVISLTDKVLSLENLVDTYERKFGKLENIVINRGNEK